MWTMVALSLLVSVSPVAAELELEDGYLLLQKNKEPQLVQEGQPPPPPAPRPHPAPRGGRHHRA